MTLKSSIQGSSPLLPLLVPTSVLVTAPSCVFHLRIRSPRITSVRVPTAYARLQTAPVLRSDLLRPGTQAPRKYLFDCSPAVATPKVLDLDEKVLLCFVPWQRVMSFWRTHAGRKFFISSSKWSRLSGENAQNEWKDFRILQQMWLLFGCWRKNKSDYQRRDCGLRGWGACLPQQRQGDTQRSLYFHACVQMLIWVLCEFVAWFQNKCAGH